jgi:16S rRNA processing protein RimM
MYLDECGLDSAALERIRVFEWRPRREGATRTLHLRRVKPANNRMLVCFEGIGLREAASDLTLGTLWADAALLPDLGPGRAWTFQLIGLTVLAPDGTRIGTVKSVAQNVGQQLFVVDCDGEERVLPGFEPFLQKVDLAAGTAILDLPPGFDEI